jgi:hypothetical protein
VRGQAEVERDHAGPLASEQGDGLVGILGEQQAVALPPQPPLELFSDVGVVIDNEQLFHWDLKISSRLMIKRKSKKYLTPAPKASLESQRRREEGGHILFSAETGGKQEGAALNAGYDVHCSS